MSRKQEIYRDMLFWALPHARNSFSHLKRLCLCRILWRKQQLRFRSSFEIAQLVHNLYGSILQEDFVRHDIDFLNWGAKAFYERNTENSCELYALFAYYFQELFKVVPEEMRHELKWSGPEGDWSWARPRRGWEIMRISGSPEPNAGSD